MAASQSAAHGDASALLRELSAKLHQATEVIKSGDVDSMVLRDFREAVDNARQTAWVVQEWLDRQAAARDPYALLPALTAERIRRMKELSHNLLGDLDAYEVTTETEGLKELFIAVEPLGKRLAFIFKET